MKRSAFISNIILIAMLFVMAITNLVLAEVRNSYNVETEVKIVPATPSVIYIFDDELPAELVLSDSTDIGELQHQMELCDDMIQECEHIININSKLDGVEHPLYKDAVIRKEEALGFKTIYENRIVEIEERELEYPVATHIWSYLKAQGYNDWVCAGIIGNMMNEAGGNTLNIKPTALSQYHTYYGICQWGKHYKSVWNRNLDGQLEFLQATIETEFNEFGRNYKRGFNYSEFMKLTDEKEAALAFSKCYERNYSSSYSARQKNATAAYKYFVSQ